jgi:hypothetical protein
MHFLCGKPEEVGTEKPGLACNKLPRSSHAQQELFGLGDREHLTVRATLQPARENIRRNDVSAKG